MKVNYNQELSEFKIEINGNVFIIPSRKITDFKKSYLLQKIILLKILFQAVQVLLLIRMAKQK